MTNNIEIIDQDEFFKTDAGKMKYCTKCTNCKKKCKQSFRVEIIVCPKYEDRNKDYRK